MVKSDADENNVGEGVYTPQFLSIDQVLCGNAFLRYVAALSRLQEIQTGLRKIPGLIMRCM